MTEGDETRLVAWDRELRAVHQRLRDALRVTQEAATHEAAVAATRDLLLYCHGFCSALAGHHQGEDRVLFPAIAAARPDLSETLRRLEEDHVVIADLLARLQAALERSASPAELDRHLQGVAAIMESHFRFEERQLSPVLATLALDAAPTATLGPL